MSDQQPTARGRDINDQQPTVSQSPDADATLGARPPAASAVPPELADHPRYRVIKLLGAGGMGAVYFAEHRVMQRPVALKVISPSLVNDPAAVERFRREVHTAAKLTHPNIVTAYDAEQVGNLHFLVMEYVEGTSLDRVVKKKGPLPVPFACSFVRQAALGLQHAFEKGMVHRDIKPHNLMLTPKARVKVLDFGLARFASERGAADVGLTGAHVVMGTPDYIAPEQANDARSADIRADIYSLGCTFYHLLTGRPPFAGAQGLNKLMSHIEHTPPPVSEKRDDMPAGLVPVLDRMLAKKPADRYQTPAEVAKALAPFVTAAAAPQPDAAAPLWRRPWIWVAASVAALAIVSALFGAVYLRTRKKDKNEVVQVAPAPETSRNETSPKQALPAPAPAPAVTTKKDADPKPFVPPGPPKPGRLGLDGDDMKASLIVSRNGKRVGVLDAKQRELELPPGSYDIDFADARPTLRLSGKRVVVASERAAGITISREPGVFLGHTGHVLCVALYERFALTGGPNGELKLWDLDSEQLLHSFAGHTGFVRGVAFSPAGRTALSVGDDKLLHHWNIAGRKEEQPAVTGAFDPPMHCVAFLDNRSAVTGSADRGVRLWDLNLGRGNEKSKTNSRGVTALSVWPHDRGWVLTGSGVGTLRLLNPSTESEKFELPEQKKLSVQINAQGPNGVRSIAVSPLDPFLILTGGPAGAKLFNIQTRELVMTLKPEKVDMGNVNAVAFLRDGKRALTASQDGCVRLWNVVSGRELECFKGHIGDVRALAVTSDGKRCVSVGNDRTMRVWSLPDEIKK